MTSQWVKNKVPELLPPMHSTRSLQDELHIFTKLHQVAMQVIKPQVKCWLTVLDTT